MSFLPHSRARIQDPAWISGWGLKFFDYDNDGNLDLILANGFPDDAAEQESHFVTYQEPLLLFQNEGSSFRNVREQGGTAFARRFASRGLATGDFTTTAQSIF